MTGVSDQGHQADRLLLESAAIAAEVQLGNIQVDVHATGIVPVPSPAPDESGIENGALLRQRAALFEATKLGMGQGLCVWDADDRLVTWNLRFVEIMQIDPGVVHAGMDFGELMLWVIRRDYPDGEEQVRAERWRALIQLNVQQQLEFPTAGGRTIEAVITPMHAGGVVVTYNDLTRIRGIERDLRDSEERFRKLADAAIEALLILVDDIVVDANERAAILFGAERAWLVGRSAVTLIAPEHQAAIRSRTAERVAGLVECSCVRADGTRFHAELSAQFATQRDRLITVLSLRDAGERERLEQAAGRRERMLRAIHLASERFLLAREPWRAALGDLLAALGQATGVTRAHIYENRRLLDGRVVADRTHVWTLPGAAVNPAAPNYLADVDMEQIGLGRWRQVLESGRPVVGDVRDFPADERALLAPLGLRSVCSVPILVDGRHWGSIGFDQYGTPRTWHPVEVDALTVATTILGAAVAHDETERARADAQRQAERANRAKSQFLAMMSHEIRTPLNGVLGMLQLLGDTSLNETQRGWLDMARESGRSLMGVLNDLLDISRMEAGRLRLELMPFDAALLVHGALEMLRPRAAAKGLMLEASLSLGAARYVLGDAGRLQQVLLNLISNALKFTEYGSVTVTATIRPAPHSPAASAQSGATTLGEQRWVEFAVVDTGIGIEPSLQPLLFQEFMQLQPGVDRHAGAGLGLAISKRIAELMGGTIGFDSQPGEGSRFWVRLPFFATDAAQVVPPPLPEPLPVFAPAQRPRLLLVEDSPTNRAVAMAMLKTIPVLIETAEDGAQAVEKMRQGVFDLVLMDVAMPVMDGFAATAAIRALDPPASRVPIIAMTANAMAGDEDRCLRAGMDDYLSKPVDRARLVAVIARWTVDGAERLATVDDATLTRLAHEVEQDSLRSLLQVFLDEAMIRVERIERSVDADDPALLPAIEQEAHSLKSSAETFGARLLAARAAAIELACQRGDPGAVAIEAAGIGSLLGHVERGYRERGLLDDE